MPTLYEIAKEIQVTDERGKVNPRSEPITKGLTPSKAMPKPGYNILLPEQIAALEVPQLTYNGKIEGYQRGAFVRHARNIGKAIQRGEEMPPLAVSLWNNSAVLSDGQHRGIGAIIARKPLPAVVKHRSDTEQAKLFANQRQAKPVSPDTIVLAQHGLFAEYVQDAVTSADHSWASIVGFQRSGTKIGPSQMLHLIQGYVGGAVRAQGRELLGDDRFNRDAADRLAELLLVFGTRKDNPLAWKPKALRATTNAAVRILRRTGERPVDVERWKRHMPTFPFAKFAHIGTAPELSKELVRHWNKRLHESRQVSI